jgi:histidinol-phosphate phosphatase family protein
VIGQALEAGTARGPVVFLDKDGTLIEDLPYNVDPSRIRFAPGARSAMRRFADAGIGVAIVTNQSGVARGYFAERDLDAVAAHLRAELADLGVPLLGFYACPHLPDGINEYAIECDCRKPLPGLIARASAELGVDPRDAWFVGDTWMDVAAGRAAGCRTILVGPDVRDVASFPPEAQPDHAVADLDRGAEIIVAALREQRSGGAAGIGARGPAEASAAGIGARGPAGASAAGASAAGSSAARVSAASLGMTGSPIGTRP